MGGGIDFACPDGPVHTRARVEAHFGALAKHGAYDPASPKYSWGLFRLFGLEESMKASDWHEAGRALLEEELPTEEQRSPESQRSAALAAWQAVKKELVEIWQEHGPFDAIGGICEGAAAAAELCLDPEVPLRPPPKRLLQIGGFRAPALAVGAVGSGGGQPGHTSCTSAAAQPRFASLHVHGQDPAPQAGLFSELHADVVAVASGQPTGGARMLAHAGPGRALPLMTDELDQELGRLLGTQACGSPQAIVGGAAAPSGPDAACGTGSRGSAVAIAAGSPGLLEMSRAAEAAAVREPSTAAPVSAAAPAAATEESEPHVLAVLRRNMSRYLPESGAPLSLGTSFVELGLGSFEWILIREGLRQQLGLGSVPLHLFYTAPSVGALAQELERLAADASKQAAKPEPTADLAAGRRICELPHYPPVARPEAGNGEEDADESWDAALEAAKAAALRYADVPRHLLPHKVGEGSRIGEGIIFEGPVTIGERSILKGSVIVGGGTEILDDVRISGRVRFGSRCRIGSDVRIQGAVTLGEDCKLESQVMMTGPIRAGNSNTFDTRCFLGKVDERRGGHIEIGHHCLLSWSCTVVQPRPRLQPSWLEEEAPQEPVPEVTRLGNNVFVTAGITISHNCVVEDNCSVNGMLVGFCHLMKGARTSPQSIVHQFTTLGAGAFVTMSIKVAADVLPYTVLNADGRCLVDSLGLARHGIDIEGARELEDFYRRHFSQPAATCLRELPADALRAAQGRWFEKAVQDFLAIRNTMRDMRPLQLVSSC